MPASNREVIPTEAVSSLLILELAHLLCVKAAARRCRGGLRPALTRKCCQQFDSSRLWRFRGWLETASARFSAGKEVRNMQCQKCSYGDPVGEAHYHIVVEQGKVTEVWYLSADGYWDRELEKDEWFVEYTDDPKQSGFLRKGKVRRGKKAKAGRKPKAGKSAPADWLEPKLYKGKSMADEEAEKHPGWQVYKGEVEEDDEYLS
jgi:hypothetical protein